MHRRWVYRSNNKLLPIVIKIGMHGTCNPTVGFSKYVFNNKLLGGVTFFRVTSRELELNSIFLNSMWILTNLPLNYIIFIYFSWLQNFKVIKD